MPATKITPSVSIQLDQDELKKLKGGKGTITKIINGILITITIRF